MVSGAFFGVPDHHGADRVGPGGEALIAQSTNFGSCPGPNQADQDVQCPFPVWWAFSLSTECHHFDQIHWGGTDSYSLPNVSISSCSTGQWWLSIPDTGRTPTAALVATTPAN